MKEQDFVKKINEIDGKFCVDDLKLKIDRKFIRINNLKIEENDLLSLFDSKNIKYKQTDLKLCYEILDSDFNLVSMTEYLKGYFYFQDYGSQLVAAILDVKEDELVLDMASAPGSKTTQMAQNSNNKSNIVALELNFERINKMQSNMDRMGVDNLIVLNIDAKDFLDDDIFAENNVFFDKILLDAPCSGNYLIEDDWFFKRTYEDIQRVSYIQLKILMNAIKLIRKGGELVYSTCTMNVEENEFLINQFLMKCGYDVEIVDISKQFKNSFDYKQFIVKNKLDKNIANCLRIMPNNDGLNPFFICKIKKV